MPYHRLSENQLCAIEPYIRKQIVYDLGAGDCSSSTLLLSRGASRVMAIDKDDQRTGYPDFLRMGFDQLAAVVKDIDVAFISWPVNHYIPGLLQLIRKTAIVIYLGSNTDGNACGHPHYFEDFRHRELLAYVPEKPNTLAVYGNYLDEPRSFEKLRGEEIAAITIFQQDRILTFEEVEKAIL